MKNFAKVTIYNKHLYVTRIEEVEAYTLDQLFSDMGKKASANKNAISIFVFYGGVSGYSQDVKIAMI